MNIMKSQITFAILAEEYGTLKILREETLKMISDFYGEEAVQKIRTSGAYKTEYGDFVPTAYLTAGMIDEMPNAGIDSWEMEPYIIEYMKNNGMWPTEVPIESIVRYTNEVAIPLFVNAGLLEKC